MAGSVCRWSSAPLPSRFEVRFQVVAFERALGSPWTSWYHRKWWCWWTGHGACRCQILKWTQRSFDGLLRSQRYQVHPGWILVPPIVPAMIDLRTISHRYSAFQNCSFISKNHQAAHIAQSWPDLTISVKGTHLIRTENLLSFLLRSPFYSSPQSLHEYLWWLENRSGHLVEAFQLRLHSRTSWWRNIWVWWAIVFCGR